MQHKRLSLRFDLDRPEEKRGWDYLQGLNAASMNKAVLIAVSQAERASRAQSMIRGIIREELAAALEQLPVQPLRAEPRCDDEVDNTIMDFLDSFM